MTSKEDNLSLLSFGNYVSNKVDGFLKSLLKNIFKFDKDITNFIGNHPVNLTKHNVNLLFEQDYFVCEKTDGIRAFLLCIKSELFFYDRTNKFVKIEKIAFDSNSIYVFDGEIHYNTRKKHYSYAIFDMIIFSNINFTKYNLNKRLDCANNFVKKMWPVKAKNIESENFVGFTIYLKCFLKAYAFKQILDNLSLLSHKNDGLIFTPINSAYEFYTRSQILKWKPPHLQTIDFIVESSEIPFIYNLLCVFEGRQMEQMYTQEITKKEKISLLSCKTNRKIAEWQTFDAGAKEYEGKICEFFYDEDKIIMGIDGCVEIKGGWELYKIRNDKTEPNNITVVLSQMNSVDSLINETDFLEISKQIKNTMVSRDNISKKNQIT